MATWTHIISFDDIGTENEPVSNIRDSHLLMDYMIQWDHGDGGETTDTDPTIGLHYLYETTVRDMGDFEYVLVVNWAMGDATLYSVER